MCEPRWLELTKNDVKGNTNTDRRKSGSQPTSERALRCLYGAVLGQIGAELRPFRALVGALAFYRIIFCHTDRLTASSSKAIV